MVSNFDPRFVAPELARSVLDPMPKSEPTQELAGIGQHHLVDSVHQLATGDEF